MCESARWHPRRPTVRNFRYGSHKTLGPSGPPQPDYFGILATNEFCIRDSSLCGDEYVCMQCYAHMTREWRKNRGTLRLTSPQWIQVRRRCLRRTCFRFLENCMGSIRVADAMLSIFAIPWCDEMRRTRSLPFSWGYPIVTKCIREELGDCCENGYLCDIALQSVLCALLTEIHNRRDMEDMLHFWNLWLVFP